MRLFFIGIGGIGMSALARYFLYNGHEVGGYDRVRTPNTQRLEEMGARIIYDDDPELIPELFRAPHQVTIVYTPAIHDDNKIRTYYRAAGYEQLKRAQVLGMVTQQQQALCVAGTHGKTTTSTLLAHLLRSSHIGTSAFLGGIALNYDSNLLTSDSSTYIVVEADEYDRSFHQLHPAHTIITSTEPDHLDIYGTEEAYKEAFTHYARLVAADGLLLLHDQATFELEGVRAKVLRYGEIESSDYRYSNICYEEGELYFDWHHPKGVMKKVHLGTPIEINVTNATAALALAQHLGCTEEELRAGLSSFKGAHRRFERRLNSPAHPVLIDDYAHHPQEIEASLRSIGKLYPDTPITVVFQPHLYSRTEAFMEEFGRALSHVDDVILLPIYPAREEPIPGVTSESILPYLSSPQKKVVEKAQLVDELKEHHFSVLIMMGAGDIEFEVHKVESYLLSCPR
ncbi:MAG: UDP-N-acetylmuramate--L-alanine ligase [Porphyromonas sp.]|nr:UDP-N-acetylmuramate--L-alanine ligase [Porphyromonas sp.]